MTGKLFVLPAVSFPAWDYRIPKPKRKVLKLKSGVSEALQHAMHSVLKDLNAHPERELCIALVTVETRPKRARVSSLR